MNEFIIQISTENELKFRGELISSIEKDVLLKGESLRFLKLAVYSVEEGGFVSEFRLLSTNDGEKELVVAEELDCFDDIDKFFYVFDFKEQLDSFEEITNTQRTILSNHAGQIVKVYQKVLFPFLEDVKNTVLSRQLLDQKDDSDDKPGAWDSL